MTPFSRREHSVGQVNRPPRRHKELDDFKVARPDVVDKLRHVINATPRQFGPRVPCRHSAATGRLPDVRRQRRIRRIREIGHKHQYIVQIDLPIGSDVAQAHRAFVWSRDRRIEMEHHHQQRVVDIN